MFQDAATVDARHRQFINRVCAEQQVWGLRNLEGWATSESNDFEDAELLPFWSARAYAAACCQDAWAAYVPAVIPLAEFLEAWCVDIHKDSGLIATDMDAYLFGREVEPLELALQLLEESQRQGKTLPLRNYRTSEEFAALIRATLYD